MHLFDPREKFNPSLVYTKFHLQNINQVNRFYYNNTILQATLNNAAAAAAKSLQSCLTLSDPMDCSLPGSSVHGIFQARVLEWGVIAFFEL